MYKNLLALLVLFITSVSYSQTLDYPYQGVPFNKVKLEDKFWLSRVETNRLHTIPFAFDKCETTGRVQNFSNAANKMGKFLTVYTFDDTDIYKTIEGASFSMSVHPDKLLDLYIDSLINLVAAAQEKDGYLYTARTIDPEHPHDWAGKQRWVKEWELSHELYNSGHLFEAAVAHYLATSKRNFLDIAIKNADLLVRTFGPNKRNDPPGHQIVEMGLVRLYRVTGKKQYLDLAKFFIETRGRNKDRIRSYSQDHIPAVEQREAVGHAVRAAYFYSGMADVAALTGDTAYLNAIDSIWNNVVYKKFYINGGIGARHHGEAFGDNYELPNKSAYNETCAAIANVYWNFRMFELHGHAQYIDVLERSLYNNVISGVSLDGMRFFYPNPLAADTTYNRKPWFDCSCCPTNLTRFISSVSGYIYAQKSNEIFVNLYIASTSELTVNQTNVLLSQSSDYPWNGDVVLKINPKRKTEFTLKLRIPGWAQDSPVPSNLYSYQHESDSKPVLKVNGVELPIVQKDGYAFITRKWKKGDVVNLHLPMEIKKVVSHPAVKSNQGLIAIERGPILYCMESVDNKVGVNNIIIPVVSKMQVIRDENLLKDVVVIKGEAVAMEVKNSINKVGGPIKMPFISSTPVQFTAIPYAVWNNRGATDMKVWFPQDFKDLKLAGE